MRYVCYTYSMSEMRCVDEPIHGLEKLKAEPVEVTKRSTVEPKFPKMKPDVVGHDNVDPRLNVWHRHS